MFICIPMVAETAEYAFSARFPNVFHLRVDCGDDGICVSVVDAQCVFCIPMAVEIVEYAFSARFPSVCLLRARCGDGGFCVFSADAHCIWDSDVY